MPSPAVSIPQKPKAQLSQANLVARGNSFQITRPELDKEVDRALLNFNLNREKVSSLQMGKLEYNILNQMVNRRVALEEARKRPMTNATALAKEQLEKMKKNFPTPEAFQEQLRNAQTTETEMLKEIEQKLEIDNLMRARVEPDLTTPSEEEARAFYNENPKLWQRKETVRAQHVLIKADAGAGPTTKAEKRDRAEAALARVKRGESFEDVAREVSEDPGSRMLGGELPPFSRGQMTPKFETVAFATPPGEISPVFESPFGYHFLKVKAKEAARDLDFEEVRKEVLAHLGRLRQGKKTNEYLDNLRQREKVSLFLPKPPPDQEESPFREF
jgi:parvulin-like peptidyl-prolyl isomerase